MVCTGVDILPRSWKELLERVNVTLLHEIQAHTTILVLVDQHHECTVTGLYLLATQRMKSQRTEMKKLYYELGRAQHGQAEPRTGVRDLATLLIVSWVDWVNWADCGAS